MGTVKVVRDCFFFRRIWYPACNEDSFVGLLGQSSRRRGESCVMEG